MTRRSDVFKIYCISAEVVLAPPQALATNYCHLQVTYKFLKGICLKVLLYQLIAECF